MSIAGNMPLMTRSSLRSDPVRDAQPNAWFMGTPVEKIDVNM
jgi:hypothetical protein